MLGQNAEYVQGTLSVTMSLMVHRTVLGRMRRCVICVWVNYVFVTARDHGVWLLTDTCICEYGCV